MFRRTSTPSLSRATAPGAQISSYTWSFGDGTPVLTTGDPIVPKVFVAPGSYIITLFVTDTGGRRSASVQQTVQVIP